MILGPDDPRALRRTKRKSRQGKEIVLDPNGVEYEVVLSGSVADIGDPTSPLSKYLDVLAEQLTEEWKRDGAPWDKPRP